jgi:hypothetical protein
MANSDDEPRERYNSVTRTVRVKIVEGAGFPTLAGKDEPSSDLPPMRTATIEPMYRRRLQCWRAVLALGHLAMN